MNLVRLNQGQRFEELIKRAEATGKNNERVAVLDEHCLANKEVFELERECQIRIRALLVRQFDVATDGCATRFKRATVGGLHNSRTAAGDYRAACARQQSAGLLGGLIFRMIRGRARRAENRNAILDVGQIFESLNELAHDAKHTPGVSVQKLICPRRLQ